MTVKGDTFLVGAVSLNNKLEVSLEVSTMESTVFVGKTITVNGATSLKGKLVVDDAVTMDSALFV